MAISTKSRKKDEADAAPSGIRARRRRVVGAASLDLEDDLPGDDAAQTPDQAEDEGSAGAPSPDVEGEMELSVGSARESEPSPTGEGISAPLAFAQFPLVRIEGGEPELELRDHRPNDDAVIGEPAPGAEAASESAGAPSASTRRKASKPRKVRSEADREQQRRVAREQRLRHDELLKSWMPTQRGANMTLSTRIGSQTVEGWFKRTFVRLSRMLYRIHTFPTQQIAPEAIALIEREVHAAIGRAETALSKQVVQCQEMLERVGGRRAFYSKHFELEIIVSTKTAMSLHALYQRADELMLVIESLDFAGILGEVQRRKQIGAIHAALFGLAQSIERLHRGLYVRIAKAATEVAEVDAVTAVAAGGPVDLDTAPGAEKVNGPASGG